jgi:hypothetical protein
MTSVTKKLNTIFPNFWEKVAKTNKNINIKAKFESPKPPYQSTFETLKSIQKQCVETGLGENWLIKK